MKYAFTGKAGGSLAISLCLEGKSIILKVQDDGVGLPESMDFGHSSGLGLQLVHALAEQLSASLRLERNGGTAIILEFAR
jgi:two-component sensor histidine kinase